MYVCSHCNNNINIYCMNYFNLDILSSLSMIIVIVIINGTHFVHFRANSSLYHSVYINISNGNLKTLIQELRETCIILFKRILNTLLSHLNFKLH